MQLRPALIVLLLTPELSRPDPGCWRLQFHASADGVAAAERILDLIDVPSTIGRRRRLPPPASWSALAAGGRLARQSAPRRKGARRVRPRDPSRRGRRVVGESGRRQEYRGRVAARPAPPRTRGGVAVDGCRPRRVSTLIAWRHQVAWLPQRPDHVPRQSAREHRNSATLQAAREARCPGAATTLGRSSTRLSPAESARSVTRPSSGTAGGRSPPARRGASGWRAPSCVTLRCWCLHEPAANLDAESVTVVAGAPCGAPAVTPVRCCSSSTRPSTGRASLTGSSYWRQGAPRVPAPAPELSARRHSSIPLARGQHEDHPRSHSPGLARRAGGWRWPVLAGQCDRCWPGQACSPSPAT